MPHLSAPRVFAASLLLACGDSGDSRTPGESAGSVSLTGIITAPGTGSESTDSGAASSNSGSNSNAASGNSDSASTGTSNPGDPTDAVKFDLGGGTSGGPTSESDTAQPEGGCQKIDFLFVVDNSGSMAEEQAALVNSFDGFIASIQNTVMAQDYHIMVIDSDAANASYEECLVLCTLLPTCQGYPCGMLPVPMGCDATLGTGLIQNPDGEDCGVTGGHRYMVDGQPDLVGTFSCLANVGTNGGSSERMMESMVSSLSTLNGPGDCNDGFLRKDALLVVTFITDEEDDEESNGNPVGWNAALVAAKYGNEKSIVVLGLIGDTDQPNPVCTDQAEASPRLLEFATSFTFGSWGSICAADYAPFFDQAVSVIDSACDVFEPPG